MSSLNGDLVVMRNGRSTSQVSIYNYPEHLNPFYDDEQHKRLRFWKISKKDGDENGRRRNSFSISNLKDIWAFKSFRSKKKSSTLGINKTSESPPPLRRDFQYSTIDSRLQNGNNNNFQRNILYRSSLQNVTSNQQNNDFPFKRNEDYRQTLQPPKRKHIYGGSVTPQPQLRTDRDNILIRGSSQMSVASTNPFETDDDEDEEFPRRTSLTSSTTLRNSLTESPKRAAARKKRRAPAPPVRMQTLAHTSNNLPNSDSSQERCAQHIQQELKIHEDGDDDVDDHNNNNKANNKQANIANLAAEIESFVRTTSCDDGNDGGKPAMDSTIQQQQQEVERKESHVSNFVPDTPVAARRSSKQLRDQIDVQTKFLNNEKRSSEGPATNIGSTTVKTITICPNNATHAINSELEIQQTRDFLASELAHSVKLANDVARTRHEKPAIKPKPILKKPTNIIQVENSPINNHNESLSMHEYDNVRIESAAASTTPPPLPIKTLRRSQPPQEAGHIECVYVHIKQPPTTNKQTTVNTETTTFQSRSSKSNIENSHNVDRKEIIENADVVARGVESGIVTSPIPVPRARRRSINIDQSNGGNSHMKASASAGNGKEESPPRYEHLQHQVQVEITETPPTPPLPSINTETLRIVESAEHKHHKQPLPAAQSPEPQLRHSNINNTIDSPLSSRACSNQMFTSHMDEFETLQRMRGTTNSSSHHDQWKKSSLAPLETNLPPEKRKSVKDIIESINRSQRLLNEAANKSQSHTIVQSQHHHHHDHHHNHHQKQQKILGDGNGVGDYHDDDDDENIRSLDESQREIKRMFEEIAIMERDSRQQSATNGGATTTGAQDHDLDESQKLDNAEILKKCRVHKQVFDYRETSPTASNLDWNPLPKPKRTNNLSDN